MSTQGVCYVSRCGSRGKASTSDLAKKETITYRLPEHTDHKNYNTENNQDTFSRQHMNTWPAHTAVIESTAITSRRSVKGSR